MDWNEFGNEECFMVSLYGIALDKADIVPLLGEVDELLCATGQHSTHFSVKAHGFGQRALLFDRAWKRLQKAAPEDLVSIYMFSLVDGWVTMSDWRAVGCVLTKLSYFHLGTGLATMPDAEQRIMGLVRRWMDRLRPGYGIGFYRPRRRGPGAYGIGLSYGYRGVYDGPEYEESRAVNRWSYGMDEAVWDRGMLRDVYPYSLLTARHLEREVEAGCPLQDWIRAASWRGRLSDCQDRYTLWTVAREHVDAIRYQLAAAGALYVLGRENHLQPVPPPAPG